MECQVGSKVSDGVRDGVRGMEWGKSCGQRGVFTLSEVMKGNKHLCTISH